LSVERGQMEDRWRSGVKERKNIYAEE